MMETPNGEPLTVAGALKTISKLEGLEIGLYQRTEGMTAILWGLVTAGIYFTYAAAGAALQDDFPLWAQFIWAPWVGAGALATFAIWRSAHLTSGSRMSFWQGAREMVVYFAIFAVLFFLGFVAYGLLSDRLNMVEPGWVLVSLAGASIAMAVLPWINSSRACRSVNLVVGVLGLFAALVFGLFLTYDPVYEAYAVQGVGGALVMGGGWFVGGVWLTLKG